jgi:hypothetical protein
MIVKNKLTPVDRAFWAHCEAVAREVGLWPKWMRGEVEEGPVLSEGCTVFLTSGDKK